MAFLTSRNGISLFTVITALIHFFLGVSFNNPLFILNGIGYLVLLYVTFWPLSFLKGQASLIRWVFIVYTVLTIVLYFVMNAPADYSPLGYGTKAVEVLLLIGLWQSRGK